MLRNISSSSPSSSIWNLIGAHAKTQTQNICWNWAGEKTIFFFSAFHSQRSNDPCRRWGGVMLSDFMGDVFALIEFQLHFRVIENLRSEDMSTLVRAVLNSVKIACINRTWKCSQESISFLWFFLPFSCNFFFFSIARFIDEKRVECRVMRLSSSHYLPLCLRSFIAVWQLNDLSFLFVGIFRMQKSEWKRRRRQLLTEVALERRLCDIETLLRFTEISK